MDCVGIEFDDFGTELAENTNNLVEEELNYSNIFPSKGLYLGLDISKNSTGITIIEDGERISGNSVLDEEKGPHKEVLLRRALKKDLEEVVSGREFDLIIIEDAYVGENAQTVRLLFALNTAIDELILDGVCKCKKFLRVSNQTWKSWLYGIDTQGISKGLNDKEKIRICLEKIGIVETGMGYQDRLDSTGMLVGYFLKGTDGGRLIGKKKVRFSDIDSRYDYFRDYLMHDAGITSEYEFEEVDLRRVSKYKVIDMLTEYPNKVFITRDRVKLGNLGEMLNHEIIPEGGYFAFWVKENKLERYKVIEDE